MSLTPQEASRRAREICRMAPIVPVLVVNDVAHARPLAEALVAGGLPALEVTLRTDAALDVIRAMAELAAELGVELRLSQPVTGLRFDDEADADRVSHVCSDAGCERVDGVVAAADYHFVEQSLLPPRLRRYDESYWDAQVLSPGCLLYYLGFNRRVPGLLHHTFFFDEDLDASRSVSVASSLSASSSEVHPWSQMHDKSDSPEASLASSVTGSD